MPNESIFHITKRGAKFQLPTFISNFQHHRPPHELFIFEFTYFLIWHVIYFAFAKFEVNRQSLKKVALFLTNRQSWQFHQTLFSLKKLTFLPPQSFLLIIKHRYWEYCKKQKIIMRESRRTQHPPKNNLSSENLVTHCKKPNMIGTTNFFLV